MQNILHLQIFWLTLLIVQARSIEIENAQGRSSKKHLRYNYRIVKNFNISFEKVNTKKE